MRRLSGIRHAVQEDCVQRRRPIRQTAMASVRDIEHGNPRQIQPLAERFQCAAGKAGVIRRGEAALDDGEIDRLDAAEKDLPAESWRHQPAIEMPRSPPRDRSRPRITRETRPRKKTLYFQPAAGQRLQEGPEHNLRIGARLESPHGEPRHG